MAVTWDDFMAYHEANPALYRTFDRFAREAIAAGRTRFSAKTLFERIRWYTLVEAAGDGPKINNNYHALYARLWLQRNPEHEGFFELRRRHEEDAA